jgi:hypothetical protein
MIMRSFFKKKKSLEFQDGWITQQDQQTFFSLEAHYAKP